MDKFDVNMNVVDINEMTPLHHAAISCFDETIVKLLLNTNKCDINAKDNKGRTALHYACEKGKKSIIEEHAFYVCFEITSQPRGPGCPQTHGVDYAGL